VKVIDVRIMVRMVGPLNSEGMGRTGTQNGRVQ